MKVAVFGATGGTGRQVVKQALAAGHQVQALLRDPAKLNLQDDNLAIVPGDVLDGARVKEVIQGTDAVVVSLGNTANNPDMICSEGTKRILAAMERLQQPRRLVVVSSLGVGESKNQVPMAFKVLLRTVLKKAMEDKERQEALVKASDLDWTIVRPGGLIDGPATGQAIVGTDPAIKAGQVSRADVAAFLLAQLTDDTYLHQAPAIT